MFGNKEVVVRGGSEQLREEDSWELSQIEWLPVLPVACRRVDIIDKDSLLLEGSLCRDLGKVGTDSLKNLLLELMSLMGIQETTNRPGEGEAPNFLEKVLVESLSC